MGPTSRGSSGSSHHTIKINGNHNHNPNMTSSSSSNHPLTDSGTGKRPRSTSTLGLSSPRMTRLRLRLHALSTSVPFRYFRNSSFIPKRKRSITYLFLLLLISFLIFLPGTLNSLFNHLHLPTHLRLPTSPLDPQASAAFSLTKPRLDQSGKEVPDESEGQQEVEIQRSFEEPDFSLLSGKQPHEVGCDVPIVWDPSVSNVSDSISTSISTPNSNSNDNNTGVLVFLGVFSAAQSSDKSPAEMRRRRDLYRQIYFPQFPKNLVTAKFILGLPPGGAGKDKFRNPAAAVSRARVLRGLEEEREEFGDMVILDMEDNIDSGKTHKYFQWVAKEYAGEGQVKGRPRFVVKSDDDTLLVMPNLISAFRKLDCSTNVYWGTSAGRSQYFGDYFRGLAYAMSWPLISWIGQADMPMAHITKIEDARTGQWLRHLDPAEDPITRIDYGWTMGDWNQLDVGLETVALHWCKWDDWVVEQQEKIQKIWKDAGRPFRWDQGIESSVSVAKGKITPEEARREHDRQIQAGWDVEGNLKGDAGDG